MNMELQLIKGHFEPVEAAELLTQLVYTKIKFHESKIDPSSSEESIKYREGKIKQLQLILNQTRQQILESEKPLEMESLIQIHK
jgi:hypothetical protein